METNFLEVKKMPVKTRNTNVKSPIKKKKRTQVSSTVEGYTIPEVRKSLDLIRRSWSARNEGNFTMSIPVSEKDTIYTFGLRFMLAHHRRRHERRVKKK